MNNFYETMLLYKIHSNITTLATVNATIYAILVKN
jgi:hypothetical protein